MTYVIVMLIHFKKHISKLKTKEMSLHFKLLGQILGTASIQISERLVNNFTRTYY